MEELIKGMVKILKHCYTTFWVIPVLLIVLGEFELLPVGLIAGDVKAVYVIETVSILITALCIPLSLKLFSLVLTKKIDLLSFPVALRRYLFWSNIRLMLLDIVVLQSLFCYYLTLSNTGALCALCGLTASLFCMPSEKRLREELHITKE